MTSEAVAAAILQQLGLLLWVGGMLFALLTLRPTFHAAMPPTQELRLLNGMLGRFFIWSLVMAALALGGAVWTWRHTGGGGGPAEVLVPIGLLLAVGLTVLLYLWPYARLRDAIDDDDEQAAYGWVWLLRALVALGLAMGLGLAGLALFGAGA